MNRSFSRKQFNVGVSAALGSIGLITRPAGAAQFDFKLGHPVGEKTALNIRARQMFDDVERESGGRLKVTLYPNNQLGTSVDEIAQCRLSAIQFLFAAEANLSNLTPAPGILNTGFAFKTVADVDRTMDGPLGDYIVQQIGSVGLVTFPKVFYSGVRTITSWKAPIKTADDLNGLKIRVPTTKIMVDLFRTLGASPTALDLSQTYEGLQTHLLDGTELPVPIVTDLKLYEVQKYMTVTNHAWSGFFFIASANVWKSLPSDIQDSIHRGLAKYTVLQTQDSDAESKTLMASLASKGMSITPGIDVAGFRSKLAPYYARWRETFGANVWAMLEKSVGRLG